MSIKLPYSVLIADDDASCRESLKALLEGEGMRIYLAETGAQALDFATEVPLHMAILDQYMPGLTGVETLRRIVEIKSQIPSIIMSGEFTKETKLQAMDAGAFACISKPIQTAILRHAVQQMIDRYYPNAT